MTRTDLIVLVPWIVFCAGLLAIVCILLIRSHRATRHQARRSPGQDTTGSPGTQQARCHGKNSHRRPRQSR